MKLREGEKLSQRQLAKAAGISPTSIYLVEKGAQKRFNKGALESVAKVLGTSADEIRRQIKGSPVPHGMATIYVEPDVAGQFARMASLRKLSDTEMLRELMDRAAELAVRNLKNPPGAYDADPDDPVILSTADATTTVLSGDSPPPPPKVSPKKPRAAKGRGAAPKRRARKA